MPILTNPFPSSLYSINCYCLLGSFFFSMADISSQEAIQSLNMPPPPSTPLMSPSPMRPLQLSGFLNGDTIQVQGDTENLQFSLQFHVQSKQLSENLVPLNSPGTFACTPEKNCYENSSVSSFMTPIATEEDQSDELTDPLVLHQNCTFMEEGEICESETSKNRDSTIVTRLRSGVISPVTYFTPRNSVALGKLRASDHKVKSKKKSRGKVDVFERVLRRRSCPVRPCTSYTFFVMTNWDKVRSPTFGETSKRLGRMWSRLPRQEKKLYQEMALKDNARYKMQCTLLKSKPNTELKWGSRFWTHY